MSAKANPVTPLECKEKRIETAFKYDFDRKRIDQYYN